MGDEAELNLGSEQILAHLYLQVNGIVYHNVHERGMGTGTRAEKQNATGY